MINQEQFGYHTDSYYHCKYLNHDFDITYLCWNYKRTKLSLNGVSIKYISREGNLAKRNLRFIIKVLRETNSAHYNLLLITYFRGCSLITLINSSKKLILDIRTGAVKNNKLNRIIFNYFLKFETNFFKTITVISKSLAAKLKITHTYILPLGSDSLSTTDKIFDSLKFLYVGTLSNRNISQTVLGFSKFYHEYKDIIQMNYTIIGSGYDNEISELEKIIEKEKLGGVIELKGQIPHKYLKPFFDTHNIGISYIPKIDQFDVQPPTKTFEYLLAGMPVIATATAENKRVINSANGILINDSPEHFYKGLYSFFKRKDQYNSKLIRTGSIQYTWKNIVNSFNNNLLKTLL